MSKKVKILLAMFVAIVGIFAVFAITTLAEENQITVTYYKTNDTFASSPSVDSTNSAVTIEKGASVTLPTASDGITLADGYTLMWFTADGRAWDAGSTVTFYEDTKLYRVLALNVSDASSFKTGVASGTASVKLMADIDVTSRVDTWTTYIFLNGKTLNITCDTQAIGGQRVGVHLMGQGTVNYNDKKTSPGSSYFLQMKSHGYSDSGKACKFTIGRDVVVNAPNSHLFIDWEGTGVSKYPYGKIYGTVNVYSLGCSNGSINKTPKLEIFETANITLSAPQIAYNPYCDQGWIIDIYGGSFTLPTEATEYDWWRTVVSGKTVANESLSISGGSFSVKIPDGVLNLPNYRRAYTSAGTYDIVPVSCTLEGSDGTHAYVVQEAYLTYSANCTDAGIHYYRCACGEYYVNELPALGHSYTAIAIEKIATTSENGIKRVSCENCEYSYTYEYSFNPSEQTITIVVKTADGTKEITAIVNDIYNVTISETADGYVASFDGLKTITDPDDSSITYTIADVVKLVIPAGFTSIPTGVIKNATALEEIVLLDGANVTFGSKSIDNCTSLKSIVLGDCTVTFSSNTINGTTADLTIDATNANVTTLTSAFESKTTLKHFVMGTGKSYNFAASTFRYAGIEEFVVPDYATLTAAYATCYQTNSLKYVYIGRGITSIDNIFDQCFYMQTIVLMDVTSITGQYFACLANQGEDVLRIYHHADTLSVGGKFLHKSHGVILYTNATGWTGSMDSCSAITKTIDGVDVSYPKYTIVKGIPHEYKEGGVDATCTAMGSTGYTTDCPCGVVADATYTTYYGVGAGTAVNGTTAVEGSITVGTTTPALGHEFYENDTEKQVIVSTTDATCIKDATITYKCARCDETKTVVQENTKTGHTPDADWTVATEATCAADGLQQKMCTVCGALAEAEIIPAIGHKATGVWVTTAEATCTVGATRVQYCENGCGMNVLSETTEPNGHTPSNNWVTEVEPSCVKAGSKYQRCTICNAICETVSLDALGHEFDLADGAAVTAIVYANGFNQSGITTVKCSRCDETQDSECLPIFEAKGYSVNATQTSLDGGYTINLNELKAYEAVNGSITFGIVIANANAFGTNTFFDENNEVSTTKSIKVTLDSRDYENFSCSITGFNSTNSSLELIITSYVIDENGNVSFIQSESDYALETTIGGQSFTKVTLDLVKANIPSTQGVEAIIPSNDEE